MTPAEPSPARRAGRVALARPMTPAPAPPTRPRPHRPPGLTVAVTGPTGEMGQAFIRALERTKAVDRVIGMARSPFDPAEHRWKKTVYRRGDVLDRDSVDDLVAGADVVVHLAFVIHGSLEESRRVNLDGSRNVFEAAVAAGVKRIVYTSSAAAYGFHKDNPPLLREDDPARGTDAHQYSAQKAEVETLLADLLAGSATEAYVFRPSIVAGPDAPLLIEKLPYSRALGPAPRPASSACSTACRSSSPCSPTRASRSRSSTTTTSPRRSRRPSSAGARPASTTWPGRGR